MNRSSASPQRKWLHLPFSTLLKSARHSMTELPSPDKAFQFGSSTFCQNPTLQFEGALKNELQLAERRDSDIKLNTCRPSIHHSRILSDEKKQIDGLDKWEIDKVKKFDSPFHNRLRRTTESMMLERTNDSMKLALTKNIIHKSKVYTEQKPDTGKFSSKNILSFISPISHAEVLPSIDSPYNETENEIVMSEISDEINAIHKAQIENADLQFEMSLKQQLNSLEHNMNKQKGKLQSLIQHNKELFAQISRYYDKLKCKVVTDNSPTLTVKSSKLVKKFSTRKIRNTPTNKVPAMQNDKNANIILPQKIINSTEYKGLIAECEKGINNNYELEKEIEAKVSVLKREVNKIRSELSDFYHSLLQRSIDPKGLGLSWILRELSNIKKRIDISKLPKVLDDASIKFLYEYTKQDIRQAQLIKQRNVILKSIINSRPQETPDVSS